LGCALTISAQATTIVVSNTNDNGPGSLRQALVEASDGDTIDATGVSGIITLTTGELLVNKSVIINGPGADLLAVDGNAASAVFHVTSNGSVTISDLTIRNGQGGFGGGILNNGGAVLTVINSTLSGNAAAFGGGAYNGGGLTIVNSTLSGNMATSEGGGVYNATTLTISNSTFSGNVAHGSGGGCINGGMLLITNSTLSGNSAVDVGGGVYNLGTFDIGNTILKGSDSGANINSNGGGTVTSLGYNISSDNGSGYLTGPGDQINTDPLLGPLQDNGGPTFTHALLPGSPAIDAGNPTFTPPPFYDQRGPGYPRVANGRIDKGSFEVQRAGTSTPTPTPTSTPTVQVRVQTNPAALTFSVDGTTYTSTKTFTWASGSSHTIATTSPQNGATGIRHVWTSWTSGGAISHTVAPTTNTTYTANFRTQYYLTMSHGTGGAVRPGSGWKQSGAAVSISAIPANGYSFSNWTGSGTGSYSGPNNPASITMGRPITETATFIHH
jgi:hypothetical protein